MSIPMYLPKYIKCELDGGNGFAVLFDATKLSDKDQKELWDEEPGEMSNLKKEIDTLKDKYEEVYKADPRTAQKVGWWLNPLNKDLKDALTHRFGVTHPSNGFLKMFEMLAANKFYAMKLVKGEKINVFGNAELPGAMIYAVNHFYAQNGIKMDFVFSSLVDPKDPNKLGDEYGLTEKYRDRFIPFIGGDDWTGNVADPREIEHMEAVVSERYPGGVDLYFADGGINVDDNFNDQDKANSHVGIGQIICGLLTLRKGGTLIVKQYNFTGSWVWTLNLLVASVFTKCEIVKPKTSRHSNSETYIVAHDYVRPNSKFRDYLYAFVRHCKDSNNYVRDILPRTKLVPPTDIQQFIVDDFTKAMSQLIEYIRKAEEIGRIGFLVQIMKKIAPRETRNWISQVRIMPLPAGYDL